MMLNSEFHNTSAIFCYALREVNLMYPRTSQLLQSMIADKLSQIFNDSLFQKKKTQKKHRFKPWDYQ